MQPKDAPTNRFRARVFAALSDPARIDIIEFLGEAEKCVCEITPHLGLVQPVVSRHLKILRDCGLVRCRKEGNRRLYSITDPRALDVVDALTPELLEALSKRAIEQMTMVKAE